MNGPGARLVVAAGVCGLIAGAAAGCRSVRSDEALAMLDVSAAAGVPSFTTARFSVAGRAEIPAHEVRYDGHAPLQFGYYLPGPNGTVRVTGQALSADCLVGAASVEVDVRVGRVSTPVALVIAPLAELAPTCLASGDASQDGNDAGKDAGSDAGSDAGKDAGGDAAGSDAGSDGGKDAGSDAGKDAGGTTDAAADAAVDAAADAAVDAAADARPATDAGGDAAPHDAGADATSTPPPPACMAATKSCPGASACCSGLVCGTTSLGQVCCGNYNMTCTRSGGEDCCGQLECVSGHCCLPATYACSNASCCPGLVCGTTSLGHVCCGNAGASCKRADGADCCGALECVNGVCR
jgi:hypothetical protein